MNEELRVAFARLDRALQDARAACAAAGVPCPEEEKRVDVVTLGSVFQQIDRTLSCQIGADCTDPLDHTEFVTPAATPMAPCFTGSDHDHGVWMPIRRSRVNVIATDPTTRFVVDDAEPFKVGDTVHAIDVSGPNAGCTDLGAITLIDYNTNTITVTNNASGLNVDDWIEVTENGCVDVDSDRFKHPRLVGMLKAAHDTRLTAGDTAGVTLPGTVVVNGSIRAADVNFNATPADDELLIVQFSELTPNPDRINIIIAGVPCPEEEKPRGIDIVHGAGTMRLDQLTSITAKFTLANKPGLFVTGTVGATDGATFTTTPIADIQRQAAAAGIELPPVTVVLDGNGWKSIEKVTCRTPEGKLRTVVYGDGGDAYVDLAPAQVVALCKLAGWPKPEVHMVCTFCDGTPCEIDPASVCSVDTIRLPGERSTLVTCEDGSTSCFVREPVAVVEAMLAACKEGE